MTLETYTDTQILSRRVLLRGPLPLSSGYLTSVVLLLTRESTITNHHSLLFSYQPAPVRRYVYLVSIGPTRILEYLSLA